MFNNPSFKRIRDENEQTPFTKHDEGLDILASVKISGISYVKYSRFLISRTFSKISPRRKGCKILKVNLEIVMKRKENFNDMTYR